MDRADGRRPAGRYSWDAIDHGATHSSTTSLPEFQNVVPGDIMPAVPGASDAFVVAAVDPPRELVLTVPDGDGGNAVAWEHLLEPFDGGRTRLVVRGRASLRWLDLARAKPAAGHRRIFIERAYAVLATLPRPLLIAAGAIGHRGMEARHLRGIQRRSTAPTETLASLQRWRKTRLSCGILAALLYVAMTLFVGLLWQGYSAASQTISELSAIGAPTRPLWIALATIYTALMLAFGWSVWKSASNRALRVVGALLVTQGVFGVFWPPMHQRAVLAAGGGTLTDTLHILWTIVTSLFFTWALAFGLRPSTSASVFTPWRRW